MATDFELNTFLPNNDVMGKFNEWFTEAKNCGLKDPNAMILSTIDQGLYPSSRVVLCKDIRPQGLVFYTNYNSEKGLHLQENKNAAVLFFWDPLSKQVRMRGFCSKTSREDSEKYWATRPRDSQISQFASNQSRPLASRKEYEYRKSVTEKDFANKPIPCPNEWGGYIFTPTQVEFWIGRKDRSHDRFSYKLLNGQWVGTRLSP